MLVTLAGRLVQVLLFPGLVGAVLIGLICQGIAAWLAARWRRRPAQAPWYPLQEALHLAGKAPLAGRSQLNLAVWPALAGIVALSWAAGLLPVLRGSWAGESLPGSWILYLSLLAVPPLARMIAAGLCGLPVAAAAVRRQAAPEIARLLPLMLAGAALPLLTQETTLSQMAPLTLPGVLIGMGVAVILLLTLPWALWDRDRYGSPLASLSGRPLALFRLLEAMELTAHMGLLAVALRAAGLFPAGQDGLVWPIALLVSLMALVALEVRGRRMLLPESAYLYTRWLLPLALAAAVAAWWFG